jgi:hypothetical protein
VLSLPMTSFNKGHQSAVPIKTEFDGETRLAVPAKGWPSGTRPSPPARAKLAGPWSTPPIELGPAPSDGETFPAAPRQYPLPWRGATLSGEAMSGALCDRPPRLAAALLRKCPRAHALLAQARPIDQHPGRGEALLPVLPLTESPIL